MIYKVLKYKRQLRILKAFFNGWNKIKVNRLQALKKLLRKKTEIGKK